MLSPHNYARIALICLFLLGAFPAQAGSQETADFSDEIPTKEEFERDLEPQKQPADYAARATAKGDLDKDGIADMALIVEAAPGYPQQSILVFKGNASGTYDLWKAGNTHFIDADPNDPSENGIIDLKIQDGVLKISSATPLPAYACTQKWRNDEKGFRLIGLTTTTTDRNCACGTTVDTNLVNGRSVTSTDRDDDGLQMDVVVTKDKRSPKKIYWEGFDYQTLCHPGNSPD